MFKTEVLTVLLLLTSAAGSAAPPDAAKPGAAMPAGQNSPLLEAAGYYAAGRTSKALETCIAALEQDPSDESLYAFALEILPEGRSKYDAPLRGVTAKASALKTGAYVYYLGFCKLDRGAARLAEALANCKKARTLDPTAWPVYRELGLTYSRNGDGDRALETLAQGAELDSRNYKAYYYLAAEYERRKEPAAALKNYRKALLLLKTSQGTGARIAPELIKARIGVCADAATKAAARKTAKRPAAPPAGAPAAAKPAAAPKAVFEACMKEAGDLKRTDDPAEMEKKLSVCSELSPQDPQVRIDRAGYLMRLGKYEEAAAQYQKAAGLLPRQGPMAAFCHLRTAQTYSKLGDTAKAVLYYNKALTINAKDLNAMLGLAAACETRSDLKTAGELYERVLKAEPANATARARLDEINFSRLSDSQLLDELRFRGAAESTKSSLTENDRKLLKDMRLAERNGAVDYLKSRSSLTQGLVAERQERDHVKLMLTLAGFKNYQTYQSRDAVRFFEKKAINLRDVFALRDLKGSPLFAAGGKLTPEGMEAYLSAQNGEKSWLMPYEIVSQTPEDEKQSAEMQALMRKGFQEISEDEYLWLLKATTCPDDVLREPPCDIKVFKTSRTVKYFLCYSPPPNCSDAAVKLAGYVGRYRANDTSMPEGTRTTAFFGTGGGEKRHFCHNGKIWLGD